MTMRESGELGAKGCELGAWILSISFRMERNKLVIFMGGNFVIFELFVFHLDKNAILKQLNGSLPFPMKWILLRELVISNFLSWEKGRLRV